MKEYKDRDWLYEEYIVKKRNTIEIGKELCVSDVTIGKYLKKFNIKTRSNSEAQFISKMKQPVIITKYIRDFIIGNLLSDGGIFTQSHNVKVVRTATYQHSCKHKETLEFISNQMSRFGFKQCGNIRRYKHKKQGNIFYSYQTKYYRELLDFRKYMYKDNIKIVPNNIYLSPTVCLYWYLGDGNLTKQKSIRLYTCGFDYSEQEILVEKLKYIGILSKIDNTTPIYNHISINRNNSKKFLNYIQNCPSEMLDIYGYKFYYKE